MMNQNLPFSPDRVAQFILVRLLAYRDDHRSNDGRAN